MRTDKNVAIRLRLQGKSYSEIQQAMPTISKGTLSAWLSGVLISEAARTRILQRTRGRSLEGLLKRNRNQTKLAVERARTTRNKASHEIGQLLPWELVILGAALYWAEGYKRPIIRKGKEVTFHPVSLTNSDPMLAKAFVIFLENACGVPRHKIKASLRIFDHINEIEAKGFWSNAIGIPLQNFEKTYRGVSISSRRKRPFHRLPYGVIQIRIADTSLYHRIMGWIDGLKSQVQMPR